MLSMTLTFNSKRQITTKSRVNLESETLAKHRDGTKSRQKSSGAIAAPLTGLFNNCISTGHWPRGWKTGVWTPVFKKDDRTNCANYRPITVLNSVTKVFESLLSKQISDKTDSEMYSRMSAYRKMHSCEINLIRVTVDWKKAMDNKECVAVLSTDI